MKGRGQLSYAFAGALVVGLLVSAMAFVSLVNRVGRGYCPYSFVPPYHQYKCERLKRATSPKVVFLGGSTAQECLLPDVISRELGMDVVLAGSFVDIPMRFYLAMLQDTLNPGDVIYLMLENLHYARGDDGILSTTGVSMLLGVDASMRGTLRPKERLDLYVKKGLGWLQCVIPKRIPHRSYRRYRTAFLYEMVQTYPGSDLVQKLGTHGEDAGNYMTTCSEDDLIPQPGWFSDEFRRSLDAIVKLARDRKARVVLGNTVSYSYLRDAGVARFCEEQSKLGLPVCCSPLELCLPYGCFSDAILHCNGAGKKYVTRQVVSGLKRILGEGTRDESEGRGGDNKRTTTRREGEGRGEDNKRTTTRMEREGWPLQLFERSDGVVFELPETCRGQETFAEVIVDRGRGGCTNVVRRMLVNGREVAFSERVHLARNTLWTRWRDETGRADVRIEFLDTGAGCRGERILVEPYRFDELGRLENFNEIEGFSVAKDNPTRYVARYVATETSGKLMFAVRHWASNRYRCTLRMRIDSAIKGFFRAGTTSRNWWGLEGTRDESEGQGDGEDNKRTTTRRVEGRGVCEVKIVPNESDGFVDAEGTAHFGLRFEEMPKGAVVELIDCKFDML